MRNGTCSILRHGFPLLTRVNFSFGKQAGKAEQGNGSYADEATFDPFQSNNCSRETGILATAILTVQQTVVFGISAEPQLTAKRKERTARVADALPNINFKTQPV